MKRLLLRARNLLQSIPYDFVALAARVATFVVFWRSGQVKLSDWAATLSLFETEYKVPLIPYEVAAYMAASVELGCSVLVLVGLLTRASTLAFVGMIAIIQIFVYPAAWPDHVQWLGFLFILVARGPGRVSLDALIERHWLVTEQPWRRA